MNRVPGPRTPQSNVESGVEDDQEWLQHWSMGAWGGRKPKKKMVIFGGVPFYVGGCRRANDVLRLQGARTDW